MNHTTPRTDAVLNTFDGNQSKLAAALARHAETLERELAILRLEMENLKAQQTTLTTYPASDDTTPTTYPAPDDTTNHPWPVTTATINLP